MVSYQRWGRCLLETSSRFWQLLFPASRCFLFSRQPAPHLSSSLRWNQVPRCGPWGWEVALLFMVTSLLPGTSQAEPTAGGQQCPRTMHPTNSDTSPLPKPEQRQVLLLQNTELPAGAPLLFQDTTEHSVFLTKANPLGAQTAGGNEALLAHVPTGAAPVLECDPSSLNISPEILGKV